MQLLVFWDCAHPAIVLFRKSAHLEVTKLGSLKAIQTKDDNYKDNDKDIVLKISLSILKNSRVHTTAITIKAQRNYIFEITFRKFFSQLFPLSGQKRAC